MGIWLPRSNRETEGRRSYQEAQEAPQAGATQRQLDPAASALALGPWRPL